MEEDELALVALLLGAVEDDEKFSPQLNPIPLKTIYQLPN